MKTMQEFNNEAMQGKALSDDELNKVAGGYYDDDERYEYEQACRKLIQFVRQGTMLMNVSNYEMFSVVGFCQTSSDRLTVRLVSVENNTESEIDAAELYYKIENCEIGLR